MSDVAERDGAVSGLRIPTEIGAATPTEVFVRGHNLATELLGKLTFTEMAYLTWTGRRPTPQQRRVLDAVLVTLVDHGVTPSAIAARLTYHSAPDALQGAVSAGLLGSGSVMLGSMEGAGMLLAEIADGDNAGARAETAVRRLLTDGKRVPGMGHALHKSGDPRVAPLLAVADEERISGRYVAALRLLPDTVRTLTGKQLPLNATGAIAALLLELDLPWQMHRGVAVTSRSVGLLAHVMDEARQPITPALREAFRAHPKQRGDS